MSNDFSVSPCTGFVNVNIPGSPCPTCGHISLVMNESNCYQGLFAAVAQSYARETFQPIKACPDCPPTTLTMHTFVILEGYWHVKGCPRTKGK